MGRIKNFERISSSKEFDFVYKKTDKTWHTPWFVLFYKDTQKHKVAFVASKKVGNAVMRNRAKRILRACFVSRVQSIEHGHYVFIAKKPILECEYKEVFKSYSNVLKKLKLII